MTKIFGTQFCNEPTTNTTRTFGLSNRNLLKLQTELFKAMGYSFNPRKAQKQLKEAAKTNGFYQIENQLFSLLKDGWCKVAILQKEKIVFTN